MNIWKLIHHHVEFEKPSLGEIVICRRFPHLGYRIMFKPDLAGAGWHRVPGPPKGWKDGDDDTLFKMMRAGSAEEAMAVLRAANGI